MDALHRLSLPAGSVLRRVGLLLAALLPLTAGALLAANPDDPVVFDFDNTAIKVVNGGFSGTVGAVTVVASSTVGSGVAFADKISVGTVSPAQQLYYWNANKQIFVKIDLTMGFYPRSPVPVPTGKTLVPFNAQGSPGSNTITWDPSTNSIVYFEQGAATGSTLSSIARGVYRLKPAAGTNTLVAAVGASVQVHGLAVKADGTIYGLFDNAGYTAPQVVLVDASATFPRVDGGVGALPAYNFATSVSWDSVNQKILLFDQGSNAGIAKVLSITPSTTAGTRAYVSNGSAGPLTTNGGALLRAPTSGFRNTAGRLLLTDFDASFTAVSLDTIPVGSSTEAAFTASTFGVNAPAMSILLPTLPTITSPTAAPGTAGTSATLGANVTSAGTALVTPPLRSVGVVYARTSTNASPTLGGTGVAQAVATPALGVFTVAVSTLAAGTQYSYAGYVSTDSGVVYTAISTFTTPTLPSVTSPTATSITTNSASLGGNVTTDGGGTLSARGIVYSSTNTNPTLGGTGVISLTDPSATTGVFTDGTGSALTIGTTYYYSAYATNGVGTAYSPVANFKTVSAPTANSQSVNVPFNTATAVTLTGSDTNTPAQTLTYTVTTGPTHGTLAGTAPNLTYTPTNGSHGIDYFQFTTTNTSGAISNVATVTLTVATGTPTANSQSVTVPFNTATPVTLTGSDPDSPALALTYSVITSPAHGAFTGTAPNLTYNPAANFQGTDSFNFTVSNGTNASGAATVSITVAAGTPTANGQSGLTTNLNTPKAITLSGSDPDSPALALTYSVATPPAHGSLSGTGPNLTYTPATDFYGTDSFTFTASNGQKTSAAATVSILVVGQPYMTSFTPSGPVGSVVTINGNNFLGTTGLTFFRNVAAPSFTVISNTQLTVTVPAGAKTGVISVTNGSGSNTTSTKFTVTP